MKAIGESLLGADGPFARLVEDFSPRPEQQQLADAIAEVLADTECLVAEAGTGTGKTFAYLAPLLAAGCRAVVSTGTRTLQDQLFKRDLPAVLEALEIQPKVALLKGRTNYLCRYRLDLTRNEGEFNNPRLLHALESLASWSARTSTGELSDFPELADDSPLLPRVTSTIDNCLGAECPDYDECFLVRARRRAMDADLVVVNHHLLFADMALKQEGFGELLPGANAVVVDEAHQLAETAGRFFGQSLSARQLREFCRDARGEAGGVSGTLSQVDELADRVELGVKRLRLTLEEPTGRGVWQRQLETVSSELQVLREALTAMIDWLDSLAESSAGLAACAERGRRLVDLLVLFSEPDSEDHVAWYEVTRVGFRVQRTPLSVAEPMRAFRIATGAAWIFTSATLAVGSRFDLFTRELGLDEPRSLLLTSPFDFQQQSLLYHPEGLPEPAARDYVDRLVDAVLPILEASGGRAFLLFTSHRNLRRAAELLSQRCDLPLFVQGEQSRHLLLESFRSSGNGVLLGAASFWEGVDVRGDALSCVVIDKLPFAAPDDPVLEARLDRLRREGGNPFRDYQLPTAVLALKQGVGRLIRDARDRGVMVICDPRLTSKGYGRVFLASLPPMPYSRDIESVRSFFASADP
jgi:ATP-dependent DNA helicase DinG